MKKFKQKLLLSLFGIKVPNSLLKSSGINRTIVPKIFVNGVPESEIIWDRDKFQNKIYV